jgi:AhpD family alkylhydroperoxidase
MQARMKNPGIIVPGVLPAIQTLVSGIRSAAVPPSILHLTHLRTSQINGCSYCVDGGIKQARQEGETEERLMMVSAWREAPCFQEAERAALALAEAMTRMADGSDPVPDPLWNEVARHFEEPALARLVLWISVTNLFNRINVTTRQIAGAGW